MPSFLCDYAFAKLLDFELGGTAPSIPPTWHVGLCLAPASKAGLLHDANAAVAEVSGGGYARVALTNNSANFPNANRSWKTNGTAIVFPAPTAAWGMILSAFLADAATAGNVWRHWDIETPFSPINGSVAPSIPVGNLWLARN